MPARKPGRHRPQGIRAGFGGGRPPCARRDPRGKLFGGAAYRDCLYARYGGKPASGARRAARAHRRRRARRFVRRRLSGARRGAIGGIRRAFAGRFPACRRCGLRRTGARRRPRRVRGRIVARDARRVRRGHEGVALVRVRDGPRASGRCAFMEALSFLRWRLRRARGGRCGRSVPAMRPPFPHDVGSALRLPVRRGQHGASRRHRRRRRPAVVSGIRRQARRRPREKRPERGRLVRDGPHRRHRGGGLRDGFDVFHGIDGPRGGRAHRASGRSGHRAKAAASDILRIGRRPHAGGPCVPHADGEGVVRHPPPCRCGPCLPVGRDRPHDRRRDGVVRHAGRRGAGGTRRACGLRGTPRGRRHHGRKAPRRIPDGRIRARTRPDRRGRRPRPPSLRHRLAACASGVVWQRRRSRARCAVARACGASVGP